MLQQLGRHGRYW